MGEAAVQSVIRRDFAFVGPVWRNNTGVFMNPNGQPVRCGLANESKQENEHIKSSDLICITPVQAYVEGRGWCILGVFTAIETKPEGWHMTPGDKRAIAQQKFHDIVREHGGFAGFATSIVDVWRIIGRHGY